MLQSHSAGTQFQRRIKAVISLPLLQSFLLGYSTDQRFLPLSFAGRNRAAHPSQERHPTSSSQPSLTPQPPLPDSAAATRTLLFPSSANPPPRPPPTPPQPPPQPASAPFSTTASCSNSFQSHSAWDGQHWVAAGACRGCASQEVCATAPGRGPHQAVHPRPITRLCTPPTHSCTATTRSPLISAGEVL